MRRFLGCVRTLAVWTYEAPYAAVAAIKDHVAFYPDRVDAIDEQLAACTRRALSMKTITI